MTMFVSLCKGFSSGIWLYALFISALENNRCFNSCEYYLDRLYGCILFYQSLYFVCGHLKRFLVILLFLRNITGLIKVYPVVSESVFTGAMIPKCVRISSKCCTQSCNWRGMRVALCFLNTAVAFKGTFSSTLIFLHRIQT